MIDLAAVIPTVTASFLASMVEVVEAFTIVLAVGITQGWRPALTGAVAALVVLALLVAILGPLLSLVPIGLLQFIIGAFLILFGLRWLRKAILRASGYIAMHDEEKIFAKETDILKHHARQQRANYLAGLASFKAVLLEGVEVVFIVIAVGAGRGMLGYASLGAAAAVLLVMVIGMAVHRPLSKIPENLLKFVVGLMLTSFGVFWTGEGLGANWPGADLALLGILVVMVAVSLLAVQQLKLRHGPQLRVVK